MNQAFIILKKEFKDFFISPAAYIVISVFLVVTGWFFFTTFFLNNQADLRNFFSLLPIIFSFLIPAITMKLFAEEINIGSYEMLFTLPVTLKDIVIGKFLAGTVIIVFILIPTLLYPFLISFIGQLDTGPVIGGYFGAVLMGGAFTAAGLFASAITHNQIVAYIVGMAICFFLTIIDKMLFFFPQSIVKIIGYLGIDYHFQNISRGIIDSRDLLYFLSIIFIGLYAAYLAMEEKN